jgi:predicted peroxiredoxin
MRILYVLATGTTDPTRGSLPIHLAVNGSIENGDEPAVFLAGDGTQYAAAGAIDAAEGVGLPPMAELFEKIRKHNVPVYV